MPHKCTETPSRPRPPSPTSRLSSTPFPCPALFRAVVDVLAAKGVKVVALARDTGKASSSLAGVGSSTQVCGWGRGNKLPVTRGGGFGRSSKRDTVMEKSTYCRCDPPSAPGRGTSWVVGPLSCVLVRGAVGKQRPRL